MKVVGLTGGIGSGKTVVSAVFQHLGIPVYEADKAAKHLYDQLPEIAAFIRNEIAEDVFDKSGKVDRKKLAEVIFRDEEKLGKLNAFVHPLVRKDFKDWVKKH